MVGLNRNPETNKPSSMSVYGYDRVSTSKPHLPFNKLLKTTTMPTITKTKHSSPVPNKRVGEGYTKTIAYTPSIPVVGEPYAFGSLLTTPVTEIISMDDKNIVFNTWNSTYKIDL